MLKVLGLLAFAETSPSTLNSAYGELVESITNTAQDHVDVADALTTQVIEVLKVVERRNEDAQKKVRSCDLTDGGYSRCSLTRRCNSFTSSPQIGTASTQIG